VIGRVPLEKKETEGRTHRLSWKKVSIEYEGLMDCSIAIIQEGGKHYRQKFVMGQTELIEKREKGKRTALKDNMG